MISNISHNDKETWDAIEAMAGKPYKLFQRVRMGGNGSPRFQIVGASEGISELLKGTNQTNFCNIELRKNGIVVGFRSLQEVYAWAIPFHKLSIHSTGKQYTLYHDVEYLQIENRHSAKLNQQFFSKLRDIQKSAAEANKYIDDLY